MPSGGSLHDNVGLVLFPDEELEQKHSLMIQAEDIEIGGGKAFGNFQPELIGTVDYSYHQAGERAVTGFVFVVHGKTGPVFKMGEGVEAHHMEVRPHNLFGGIAT